MKSVEIRAKIARRYPDPVFKHIEHHVFLCAVEDMAPGIPTSPNPRAQRIDRGIYRDIREHLLNQQGTENTFHLKNHGSIINAREVERISDNVYRLKFGDEGDGLNDGAHTYKIVIDAVKELNERIQKNGETIRQFVKLEVRTGIDRSLVAELAEGLNTSVQVQAYTVENLKGHFEWLKEEIADESYAPLLAFRENEKRLNEDIQDIRDVLVLLDLFNIAAFPNMSDEHPSRAYTSKTAVLDAYINKPMQYEMLRPIVKDILRLRDIINSEASDLYNAETGGHGANLAFVYEAKDNDFPFIGEPGAGKTKLVKAALLPMLAAFRLMVEQNPKTGLARWHGGFANVRALWGRAAASLMKRTRQKSESVDRVLHNIGRDPQHWAQLYDLLARFAMAPAQP